jgi:hypothetical protein
MGPSPVSEISRSPSRQATSVVERSPIVVYASTSRPMSASASTIGCSRAGISTGSSVSGRAAMAGSSTDQSSTPTEEPLSCDQYDEARGTPNRAVHP